MPRVGKPNNADSNNLNNRKSLLLSRGRYFRPEEVKAFMCPIRSFWQRFGPDSSRPSLVELLKVEREALQGVALESELQESNLNRSRRKVLSLLASPGSRKDYVDFLLTLAKEYFNVKSFDVSRKILEAITVEDKGNWHALKELAVFHFERGNAALGSHYFEEASRNLSRYREEIEVEPGEIEDYYRNLERTISPLLEENFSWKEAASLFAGKMAGETEYQILKSVEPIPQSLKTILFCLAEMSRPIELQKLAAIFQKGEGHPGKKAVALYVRFRVDNLLKKGKEGRAEAKKLLREAKRRKLTFKPAVKELEDYLGSRSEGTRGEDMVAEVLDLLASVKSKGLYHVAEYWKIAQKTKEALAIAEEETKTVIRDEIMSIIGSMIGDYKTIAGAILLSDALFNVEDELRRGIRRVYEDAFKNEARRDIIRAALSGLQNKVLINFAKEIAEGVYAPKFTSASGKLPDTNDMLRAEKIHDFFFVRLADLAGVQEIFAEINGPYAEPVSLRANWPVLLAAYTTNQTQKVRLLSKVKNNTVAKIELIRGLVATEQIGQISKAKKMAKDILKTADNPVATIRVYCSLIKAIVIDVEKGKQPFEAMEEVRGIFSQVRKAVDELDLSDSQFAPRMAFVKQDWDDASENLVHLSVLTRESLLVQGKFAEAVELIYKTIKNFNNISAKSRRTLAYLLAESLLYGGQHQMALSWVGRIVAADRKTIDARLVKARALLNLERIEEAKETLAETEGLMQKAMQSLDPENQRVAQGFFALAQAEYLAALDKKKEALAVFRRAVELTLEDSIIGYRAIDAKWCLVNALSKWGDFEEAIKEGEALLKEYPDFPPAHQAVIAPLIALGKENEALQHIRWLTHRIYNLTPDVFANLVIIFHFEEAELKEEARKIFLYIKQELPEDMFGELSRRSLKEMQRHYPDWKEEDLEIGEF